MLAATGHDASNHCKPHLRWAFEPADGGCFIRNNTYHVKHLIVSELAGHWVANKRAFYVPMSIPALQQYLDPSLRLLSNDDIVRLLDGIVAHKDMYNIHVHAIGYVCDSSKSSTSFGRVHIFSTSEISKDGLAELEIRLRAAGIKYQITSERD